MKIISKNSRTNCRYQEVYNRRENLRFFGIPEAASGAEDTTKVVQHFFLKKSWSLKAARTLNFKELIELVRKNRGSKTSYCPFPKVPRPGTCIQKSARDGRRNRC